jgi:hypothetical protein
MCLFRTSILFLISNRLEQIERPGRGHDLTADKSLLRSEGWNAPERREHLLPILR